MNAHRAWMPDGTEDDDFAALLTDSHLRVVGRPLVDPPIPMHELAHWLYSVAPIALLAHPTGDDPRFCYANRAAQRLFGYEWSEFIRLPSRLSAPRQDQAERARLLSDVARRGFSDDYRGLRIAKSGTRFWIENTTVWNVVDAHGQPHGQAAAIRSTTLA